MGNGASSKSKVQKIIPILPPKGSENDELFVKVGKAREEPDSGKLSSNFSTTIDSDQNTTIADLDVTSEVDSDLPRLNVTTRETGDQGTPSYALRFSDASGKDISPWHDIPLRTEVNQVFNVICEIPKMTRAKFEVATKEPQNPIKQDIKKGKLRDYHGPIYWNYGMFPQTWEDPNVEHPTMKCCGDNDPLDVVEIGVHTFKQGAVVRVKVLGALAMIDEGEVDWKVITISISDPLAPELNDISDVEEKCPGVVSGIREWFRWYKTPDGKSLNNFGFGGIPLGREEALSIVAETHMSWQQLRAGACPSDKLWLGITSKAAGA